MLDYNTQHEKKFNLMKASIIIQWRLVLPLRGGSDKNYSLVSRTAPVSYKCLLLLMEKHVRSISESEAALMVMSAHTKDVNQIFFCCFQCYTASIATEAEIGIQPYNKDKPEQR